MAIQDIQVKWIICYSSGTLIIRLMSFSNCILGWGLYDYGSLWVVKKYNYIANPFFSNLSFCYGWIMHGDLRLALLNQGYIHIEFKSFPISSSVRDIALYASKLYEQYNSFLFKQGYAYSTIDNIFIFMGYINKCMSTLFYKNIGGKVVSKHH